MSLQSVYDECVGCVSQRIPKPFLLFLFLFLFLQCYSSFLQKLDVSGMVVSWFENSECWIQREGAIITQSLRTEWVCSPWGDTEKGERVRGAVSASATWIIYQVMFSGQTDQDLLLGDDIKIRQLILLSFYCVASTFHGVFHFIITTALLWDCVPL